jgi:hypothetical protein
MAIAQQLLEVCDRLGLSFVSKAAQPLGLAQAAVSGDVLLRSDVLLVQGDRFSMK